jgi:hypothetical protein
VGRSKNYRTVFPSQYTFGIYSWPARALIFVTKDIIMNNITYNNNELFKSSSDEESIDNDFKVDILDKDDGFIINIANQQDLLQQAIPH